MKLMKKLALATAAGAAMMTMSMSAQAVATIQYAGGQFTTFNGFDWSSNGTAYTTGFAPVDGDTFDLTYFAHAIALQSPNTVPVGMDVVANGGGANSTGFNWTIVANLKEKVSGCAFGGAVCAFEILAGSTFDIYYNPTFDANTTPGSLGTGYTNGIKIISGTINPTGPLGGGTFTVSGPGGTGSSSLLAAVTYTNSAFVSPDLLGSVFGTQLNLGNLITEWTNPGGFGGVAFASDPGTIVFQADGNQTFVATVPEPGSLALVALAMLGAGVAARRRKAQ